MDRNILINNLTGKYVDFDSSMYDCYIRENIGIFIPICDDLDNNDLKHNHPSYYRSIATNMVLATT